MENGSQLHLLKESVTHAYENYPFYREKMDKEGINPGDIKNITDFELVPFITKYELSQHINSDELFEKLRTDLFLIGSTSGSTGVPMPVYYTHKDLAQNEQLMQENAENIFNISARDIVQITVGRCGIFCQNLIGTMRKVGAACMPVDTDIGTMEDHLRNMNKYKVSILFAYPTIMKKYCELVEGNTELKPKYLKSVFLGGETWPDSLRTRIRQIMGAESYDYYGTTETGWIGYGCPDHQGLHAHRRCYIEIIDRTTGKKAKPGEFGEVVLTQLWNKGIPYIRYRTGDIAASLKPACTCKGNPPLLSRIQGRWDDVMNIGGVKINPIEIEDILIKECNSTPNFQIVLQRRGALEKIKIVIETSFEREEVDEDIRRKLVEGISQINADMISLITAKVIDLPEIEFVPLDSIPKVGGKIRKVLDQR
jgi:phenylacetate-CoA ligase